YWDGAVTPAIDLPARELFGAALAAPTGRSSFLAAEQAAEGMQLTLSLPMPFAAHARVVAHNGADKPVVMTAKVALHSGVPSAAFGTLHVQRNETVGPTQSPSHPLAKADGRGRWVGLCVALEGHGASELTVASPLAFLEGDPTTVIDGVTLKGTGTEEIFDAIFYFGNGSVVTPFLQVWGVDDTRGKASACRWNVHGSELDFQHSLDATLEIGPGLPELLDRYRTVAFLYL
ncbi:MAG: hypothetical protein RLZZ450_7685, partial [Pseudomonadota bacterium]